MCFNQYKKSAVSRSQHTNGGGGVLLGDLVFGVTPHAASKMFLYTALCYYTYTHEFYRNPLTIVFLCVCSANKMEVWIDSLLVLTASV